MALRKYVYEIKPPEREPVYGQPRVLSWPEPSCRCAINHGLKTTEVIVQVYDEKGRLLPPGSGPHDDFTIQRLDSDNIVVILSQPLQEEQSRMVVIIG